MIQPHIKRTVATKISEILNKIFYNSRSPDGKNLSAHTLKRIISELPSPGILVLDQSGNTVYSNPGWQTLSRSENKNADATHWLNTIHPHDAGDVSKTCRLAIENKKAFQTECRLRQPDVDTPPLWVSFQARPLYENDGSFSACLCTFTDITTQRSTNKSLEQLSLYDALTGLPNRRLLLQRLQTALEPETAQRLALVFIDLDGFKLINDTLGHTLGNKLILEVSQRINRCIEPTDLLARLGSDEFTVIVNEDTDKERASGIAKQILHEIRKPIVVEKETVYVTASLGIAISKPGITPDKLIQHADVAMYNAKKRRGNNLQFHRHELMAKNRARLIVSSHLHTALDKDEFRVFYQPQLNVLSNSICGSEALLRWKNPQLGTISPAVFIPLLEDRGLINQVGEWVLSQACHMQAQWRRDYNAQDTTVSVNVSSLQLHDRHFLTKLKSILDSSGLPADRLVLEITETALLDEYVTECNLLHEISDLGVKIAIDDFGTGYGSFLYLKKHPIDHIKIDKSFIDNLFNCEENKAITNSIIDLSHKLGKTVVAEGIDKQEELDFLMMRGCDIYQGFLSSRAIPSKDFASKFLQKARLPQTA